MPVYDGKIPLEKFHRLLNERKKAMEEIQAFLTQYTGRTVAFRYEKRRGQPQLLELNRSGSFRSASHASQVEGAGSCNNEICGIAWLRPGIYPYRGGTVGVFSPLRDDLTRVARDINHDGVIDRRESERSTYAHGFAIQIHPGFLGSPRSEGCQTFPPEDFWELQKIIQNSKVEKFYYVLARRPHEKWGTQSW
jgi:hypothetical protein